MFSFLLLFIFLLFSTFVNSRESSGAFKIFANTRYQTTEEPLPCPAGLWTEIGCLQCCLKFPECNVFVYRASSVRIIWFYHMQTTARFNTLHNHYFNYFL